MERTPRLTLRLWVQLRAELVSNCHPGGPNPAAREQLAELTSPAGLPRGRTDGRLGTIPAGRYPGLQVLEAPHPIVITR